MTVVKSLRQIMLLSFGLLYLAAYFTGSNILFSFSALLLVIVVCFTLPLASKANRNVSLALFILGALLLYTKNAPWQEWLTAVGANGGLVLIFLALPFLTFPLHYDNYELVLKNFSLKYITNAVKFGNLAAFLGFFLSSVLNMGALPIVYNLLKKSGESLQAENVLLSSITRANTAGAFWSPNYVCVAVILHSLKLPWLTTIFPYGLLLSLLVILSNWFSLIIRPKPLPTQLFPANQLKEIYIDKKKLGKLAGIFLSLIIITAVLNVITTWNILIIVPVVALFYPLLLALLESKLTNYLEQLHCYYFDTLLSIKNELVIFAAAGFFGKSLEISGMGRVIPKVLRIEQFNQPSFAILLIMLVVAFLAIIGFHPVVTTSAIAASISAGSLGISSHAYAFALLAAYGLAALVSPFSGMSLVMAGLTKRSSWEVSLGLNKLYAIGMAVILALIIPLL